MVILAESVATSEQEPHMPLVRLEVRQGRSATQKQALLDVAHAALVEALGIPDHDRMQRIVEHAREDFELPPGSSDNFVLVEVTMFAGRSRQAKRRLYQALVRNFGTLGVAPADVLVVLHEPPLDNWGIRGGQMASEVDLGFEVQV
jgi:phenylpyruvate tautomerase PptA (4-oxalocrotonate tautomerase family)